MSPLASKREELAAKQKHLHAIFEEAKTDNAGVLDLSKVKSIDGDNEHKRKEIKRLNDELSGLGQEVELLVSQEKEAELGKRLNDAVTGPPLPGGARLGPNYGKSLDHLFRESPAYKKSNRKGRPANMTPDVTP